MGGSSSIVYGILGLVLLIFALVDYIAAPGFRFFFLFNLVLGVFAIIVWATSSRTSITALAGRRSARYGANAAIYSIAFVALLVAVNFISTLHHHRFDLTSNHVYSLSSQSVKVVKELKKPLKFYGFFAAGQDPKAAQLFDSYAYNSPLVSYQMVDPDRHPELAEKYKVSVMNTVHIQYGGDNSGDGTNVTDLSEAALTNGIIRVTKSTHKVACFAQGEGEPDVDDSRAATGFGQLKTAMEGESFEVHKLLLATLPAVPADCSLLIVAGPTRPLLKHELDIIDGYLKKGGRAIVMMRPPNPADPGVESGLVNLLDGWGVKAGDDIVVDQVLRLFQGPALGLNPIVDTYGPHQITLNFDQRTVFPMTRSVEPITPLKPGLQVIWLAKTSPTSWAETDLVDLFQHQTAKLDAKDRKGPITVADVVSADLKPLGWGNGTAQMVVFGDTELVNNQYLDNFFNRDLFMNSADWLVGETSGISIRPRTMRASRLALTVTQFSIVFALSVLLLPELLIIAGIMVWWRRRT
ncbi:MAG TPA: GldG family protein [Candidatus Binataceae bacterium]|nr:GldG family protein [Candidatus Binataceae bacterium]